MRITFMGVSAPEGTDKRQLLRPHRRARRLRRILARTARRLDPVGDEKGLHAFVGLFEAGTFMHAAADRAGWAFQLSDPPNNKLRDGTVRGNAGLWRGIPDLRLTSSLRINVGKRFLYFPIFTSFKHNLVVVVGHRETRKADPDGKGRQAAEDALDLKAQWYARRGWKVVLILDWNGEPPKIPGFTVAVREGVDSILTSDGLKVRRQRIVRRRPWWRVIDHRAIVAADVEVP